MIGNYLLICLFGILAYFLATTVAREAIVGGKKAHAGEIRYQAIIYIAGREPSCGGGIIGDKFILTAAHCLIAYTGKLISHSLYVIVGTNNLNVTGEVVKVEKIFIPKGYDHRLLYPIDDIAILKLKKPLKMDKYVELTIPKPNKCYENKIARIAGLGWNRMHETIKLIGNHTDHHIRILQTTVLSDNECKQDHPIANLSAKHLCARAMQYSDEDLQVQKGACSGDDGGPLVFQGHTVLGILSVTTIDCSEKNSSAIYTRVSHYQDFIFNVIGGKDDLTTMHLLNV